MFKDFLLESTIYQDRDISRWGISSEIRKLGEKFGELKAVFQLKIGKTN